MNVWKPFKYYNHKIPVKYRPVHDCDVPKCDDVQAVWIFCKAQFVPTQIFASPLYHNLSSHLCNFWNTIIDFKQLSCFDVWKLTPLTWSVRLYAVGAGLSCGICGVPTLELPCQRLDPSPPQRKSQKGEWYEAATKRVTAKNSKCT